jgi:hypothetical protein
MEIGELKHLTTLSLGKWSGSIWSDCGFGCECRMYYLCACDDMLILLFSCKLNFIDGNNITSIPTAIWDLKGLTSLSLGKWHMMNLL